jgi:hypothetical protein
MSDGYTILRASYIQRGEEIERLQEQLDQANAALLSYAGAETALDCDAAQTVARLKDAEIDRLKRQLAEAMEVVVDFWRMRAANIAGAEHPRINLDTIALKVRAILCRPADDPIDHAGPRTKMRRKAQER